VANNTKIALMRFSLIFVETNLGLLGNPEPPKVPLGFLGNRDSFANMFDQAQQKKPVPLNLAAPWDKEGMHFWEYYLENKSSLPKTSGATAWRFLVPLRGKVPVKSVKVPSLTSAEGQCLVESFYYPHGFACVLTFTVKKTLSLADAVDVAYEIRKDEQLDVEWLSGVKEQLSLKTLAARCLTEIRQSALGPTSSPGTTPVEPFTVFTVLKGKGTVKDLSPKDKVVRGVIEAVTTWPNIWTKAKLPPLDDKVKLKLRSAAVDSDTVYARSRGRAVWFPDLFNDTTKKRSSLSCYHRNLLLASLQTESLSGLATATVNEINTVGWPELRVMHSDCAKLAAGILGRLYGGDKKETFRSLSPRYQIQQNGFESDIDLVRDKSGMAALK
jgi:hypothetical protein